MKLISLRFKNLNSLTNEWRIDFTAPEFAIEGIFAITGPTGAGKSTILDAICLAIYGRTPRLKIISKTTNEIMSRQTGECYSEAVFETDSGRYCCHFSQRRARNKSDGRLQDARHEISDAVTGKILESKKSLVGKHVEKICGMDFDRFTRSMMLAQGEFAAFLSAGEDLRAPILEQITGTRIYSDISIKVHEICREKKDALAMAQAGIDHIRLMSDEDRQSVSDQLLQAGEKEKATRRQAATLEKKIQWRTDVDKITRELSNINEDHTRMMVLNKEFEPDRARLELARKASVLDSDYAAVKQLRNQQEKDGTEKKKAEQKLPDLKRDLEAKQSGEKKALKKQEDAGRRLADEKPLFKKVRALDVQILNAVKGQKGYQKEIASLENQLADEKDRLKKAASEKKKDGNALEAHKIFLKTHAVDANLVSGFTGIREKIHVFNTGRQTLEKMKNRLGKIETDLAQKDKDKEKSAKLCSRIAAQSKSIQEKNKSLAESLDRLLKGKSLQEYRTEHRSLMRERAYIEKIRSLEEHRRHLENGKACPLCGATEHPFSDSHTPESDPVEKKIDELETLIGSVEELENQITLGREKENTMAITLSDVNKEQDLVIQVLQQVKDERARIEKDIKEAQNAADTLKSDLLQTLAPFQVIVDDTTDGQKLINGLEKRMKAYIRNKEETAALEKILASRESDLARIQAVIATLEKEAASKRTQLLGSGEALDVLKQDRVGIYNSKDPDLEEQRLEAAVESANEKLLKVREDAVAALRRQDECRHWIRSLDEAMVKRKTDIDSKTRVLLQRLNVVGFTDEISFQSARLKDQVRCDLEHQAKDLDDRMLALEVSKKDREERLSGLMANKKTGQPLELLKQAHETIQTDLKRLGELVGGLKQQLSEDDKAKKELQREADRIKALQKECGRWDALHALIGSADGKKYRNFAQGVTFDFMVTLANRQLAKMTDRYLLVRDDVHPLELNIMDNYQAGEIRSTKNLSGGESFLVSLCLALGLSNMASRNVNVDSLFLDEGFGTLDEAALETALEVLAGLQQEGKLIGIISHVPAIRERITTQVAVTPVSGGNSVITGPGCQQAS